MNFKCKKNQGLREYGTEDDDYLCLSSIIPGLSCIWNLETNINLNPSFLMIAASQ